MAVSSGVLQIIEKINVRLRKCPGLKTPNQLFLQLNQLVALAGELEPTNYFFDCVIHKTSLAIIGETLY